MFACVRKAARMCPLRARSFSTFQPFSLGLPTPPPRSPPAPTPPSPPPVPFATTRSPTPPVPTPRAPCAYNARREKPRRSLLAEQQYDVVVIGSGPGGYVAGI